jgi:integrase
LVALGCRTDNDKRCTLPLDLQAHLLLDEGCHPKGVLKARCVHLLPLRCKGNSIKRPTSSSPDIVVWSEDRLRALQSGLADRFRIVCAAGADCGLRQGEILGLSLDDTDLADMCLHVQRQIRVVGRTLVFALPKGGKKQRVPLSAGVLAAMRVHERDFSSTEITLPWDEPSGKPVTV